MKKIYACILAFGLALSGVTFQVQAQTTAVTPNLRLRLPPVGSPGWGPQINANTVTIDGAIGALQNAYKGPWTATALYSKGQYVTYSGSVYLAVLGNQNVTPGTDLSWLNMGSSTLPAPTGTNYAPVTTGANSYALAAIILSNQIGVQGGVAPLDNQAKLASSYLRPFGGSGTPHSLGAVPDPGATAGTVRVLREDGFWASLSQSQIAAAGTLANDTTGKAARATNADTATTATTASALATNPATCGTLAATGILANGNPAACVSAGGGGSTVPGGTQYQIQYNNGSTFGGSQVAVDATGMNLSTPGTVSSSSLNTVASTCTSLQSFDTYTCNGIYASFHAAADGGDAQYISLTVDGANGAGHNWGNYGGWSYRHGLSVNVKSSMRGITEGVGLNVTAHAHGDLGGLYAYIHGACVAAALSDETCFALAAGIDNFNDQFYGSVPTGTSGVGLTSFNPTYTSGLTFLMDEGFLINTSRGVIHTALAGPSYTIPNTTMPQFGDLLHAIPVTAGSVPVTTSYCLAIQQAGGPLVIQVPSEPKGQSKSVTFSCTVQPINGIYTAMPSSGVMMVAGANYPEQAPITAAGTMDPTSHVQSLTMLLRNPNESVAVFNNGSHAGGLFSFDDDFAYSSTANASVGGHPMRRAIYAIGSLDGNSLIFQYNRSGHTGSVVKMPIDGVSVAGPTSGVTLFTNYAEIVQSKNFDGAVPVLEPNAATWNAGDTLEGDSQPAVAFKALSLGVSMGLPCDPSLMCNIIQLGFSGAGVNGAAHGIDLQNGNPASVYKVAGGKMDAPEALSIGGVFGVGTGYQFAPENLIKIVQAPGGDNSKVMNLFQFSNFGLTDAIHFDTHRRDLDSVDFGNDSTAPTQPCGDTARGSTHIASVGYVANCAGSGGTLAGQVSGPVNATVVNTLGPNVSTSTNGLTLTNANAGSFSLIVAATNGGSQQFAGDGSMNLIGTPGCSYCGYINFGGIISSVNAGHDMTLTTPSGNDFIFKSQGSGGLVDLLHYHSGSWQFNAPTSITGLLDATTPDGAVTLRQLAASGATHASGQLALPSTSGATCSTGTVTLNGNVTNATTYSWSFGSDPGGGVTGVALWYVDATHVGARVCPTAAAGIASVILNVVAQGDAASN